MSKEKRCNDCWSALSSEYGAGADIRPFTAGFLSGIAEKVHMGACRAAMSSPLNADAEWVRAMVGDIAREYSLFTAEVRRVNRTEFWFFRDEVTRDSLASMPDNNAYRAMICGLDPEMFNPDYVLEAPHG